MDEQGILVLNEGKFSTWRLNLDSYFLSVDEDIFLRVEYGVKYESNDLAKNMIVNSVSKFDNMHVKHCDATKEPHRGVKSI